MFSRAGAWVDRPITIACGQCIACLLQRSRENAARILHESTLHEENSFLTLTLADENLPNFQSLDVKHWQSFAHRLRKRMAPEKLRFFHAGEYSDYPKRRPHYHAIVNLDWHWDRTLFKETDQGHNIYTSPSLDELWKLGKCFIGDVSFSSAAYVARYMMKKITGPNAADHYNHLDIYTGECVKIKPEYTTQSRRPGLGKKWIDKYYKEVYGNLNNPKDEIIINGRKLRPPKYYDHQLKLIDPELYKLTKSRRITHAEKYEDDNTPDRLAVKEKVKLARFSKMVRSLE